MGPGPVHDEVSLLSGCPGGGGGGGRGLKMRNSTDTLAVIESRNVAPGVVVY